MCQKNIILGFSAGFVLAGSALAQEPVGSTSAVLPSSQPQSSSAPSTAAGSIATHLGIDNEVVLRSVAPKTLAAMRVHPATNPDEAALRCQILEPCVMGLSRGFGVGGDAFGMLSALVYQPQARAGAWLLSDAFVNYQFFDAVEKVFNANGALGYRAFSYEDSNNNKFSSVGMTWRLNYAQDIMPDYTQGLVFSGVLAAKHTARDANRIFRNDQEKTGARAREALANFYEYSHKYPQLWLSFPATLEVINWKASLIDLPSDLRGYAQLEPFFAQNDFRFSNETFLWVERNFGLRMAATAAYESRPDRVFGRFSATASLGIELATSSHEIEAPVAEPQVTYHLPEREPVSLYGDLGVTWQF